MARRGGCARKWRSKAFAAIDEVMTILRQLPLRSPSVRIAVEYDEFMLTTEIEYEGPPPLLQETSPSADEVAGPHGDIALAGFLVRQHADEVKVASSNGHTTVNLHFEQ